ncbi:MAG: hypothetical protein LBT88_02350 [Oscillospiraceae bacterium]|jgi:hypothetical protein|nr:hypothetical protein [Oscillospiraceae bacterium]
MEIGLFNTESGYGKTGQQGFGGIDRRKAAADGSIREMRNLTSLNYPLLSVRPRRRLIRQFSGNPNGLFAHDKICYVDGTRFFYDGQYKGDVADSPKQLVSLGERIIIFPDKAYYNARIDEFGQLEASYISAPNAVQFMNGTRFGEPADRNTLYDASVNFLEYFRVADAINISGCTIHPENNLQSLIIREISEDGHSLSFQENVFVLDGAEKNEDYTEPGEITMERRVPDVEYVIGVQNRIWGATGDDIYASRLNDPFNWYNTENDDGAFGAVSLDVGDFTGAAVYNNMPIFFKEKSITRVYGTKPTNYQTQTTEAAGILHGSGASVINVRGTLYYLSSTGLAAYAGGIPSLTDAPLDNRSYDKALSGTDGITWYISCYENEQKVLLIYDTLNNCWQKEDELDVLVFANIGMRKLYALTAAGELLLIGDRSAELSDGTLLSTPIDWFVEFGDFAGDSINHKSIRKIQIRAELDVGSSITLKIKFDARGDWETVRDIDYDKKRTYTAALPQTRCDTYSLRIEGLGGAVIYALTQDVKGSSENRRLPGERY